MKNSLFKRAVAVAASLPLALTQCLTYANAVTNDAVQSTAKAVQAEGAEDITIESLLKIEKDKTVSEWNSTVSAALTEAGAKSGSIDLTPYVNKLVEKAKSYGPALKAALDKYVVPNGATYEIKDNHDIILKAKLSQPDFNGNYKNTFGGLLADIGKKYGAPGLDYIDFSSVNVAGDLTITVKASQLDGGTEVPVTFEYKTANGTYGLAEIPAIVEAKAKQLKAIGEAEIAKQVPAAQADAAKAEFDKNADKIIAAAKVKLAQPQPKWDMTTGFGPLANLSYISFGQCDTWWSVVDAAMDPTVRELGLVTKDDFKRCVGKGGIYLNDAPVLARADVGVAMGGLGSDAAIEAADAVITSDAPSKLADAVRIAKRTHRITVENIVFALGVKAVFLLLGALGIANMWVAVFGDVGVMLLAVLNALRVFRYSHKKA